MTLSEYERRMWAQLEAQLRAGNSVGPLLPRPVRAVAKAVAVLAVLLLATLVSSFVGLTAVTAFAAVLSAGPLNLAAAALLLAGGVAVFRSRRPRPASPGADGRD